MNGGIGGAGTGDQRIAFKLTFLGHVNMAQFIKIINRLHKFLMQRFIFCARLFNIIGAAL